MASQLPAAGASSPTARQPVNQLALLSVLFCPGLFSLRVLRFDVPSLNTLHFLATWSLPWLALRPFSRLRKWDRQWWGCLVLYPLLFVALLILSMHAYQPRNKSALFKDLATVNMEGYCVRLSSDCSASHTCEIDLDQERAIFPGILLVRRLDSFWGAYTGRLEAVGYHKVRVQLQITYPASPEYGKSIDQTYHVKRFVYF